MCVRLTLPQVRYCDLQHRHTGTKKRIDEKNKAVRIEAEKSVGWYGEFHVEIERKHAYREENIKIAGLLDTICENGLREYKLSKRLIQLKSGTFVCGC
jgi:hypothetical protein